MATLAFVRLFESKIFKGKSLANFAILSSLLGVRPVAVFLAPAAGRLIFKQNKCNTFL
jgi:hypothetical protein